MMKVLWLPTMIPKKEDQYVAIRYIPYYEMFVIGAVFSGLSSVPNRLLVLIVIDGIILGFKDQVGEIPRVDTFIIKRIRQQYGLWELKSVQNDLLQNCQFPNEFILMIMRESHRFVSWFNRVEFSTWKSTAALNPWWS